MNFPDLVVKMENNMTTTENGAPSYKSTNSHVLDYFSKAAAKRGCEDELIPLFDESFEEDKLLTMKIMFYSRDIRGGQGERSSFRTLLNHVAKTHPTLLMRNFDNIVKYGRWDDFYSLVETDLEDKAFEYLYDQLTQDMFDLANDKPVSLLAKWLKSENTSSKQSKELAAITRKHFHMNSEKYRKTLSALRKKIDIVESKMSSKEWDAIEYQKVPSRAMKIYAGAFIKNDKERYQEYLKLVSEGKCKINASTLYPYDIVKAFINESSHMSETEEGAYELMWNNLPNYFEDGEYNTLAVVDVSGSMYQAYRSSIRPIDVAISLGIYMAEKNKGKLHGYFMSFSESPSMVKLTGNTLKEKIDNVLRSPMGYNTNIEKVFDLLLKTIIANKIPAEQVPKKLFIISDMQFDEAHNGESMDTTYESIVKKYMKYNVKLPELVFWNVAGRADTPATKDDYGTILVSGASPSILSHALNSRTMTPYEFMLEVLGAERYESVVVD